METQIGHTNHFKEKCEIKESLCKYTSLKKELYKGIIEKRYNVEVHFS